MGPRNPKTDSVGSFQGFDSFNDVESIPPDRWPDSLNVVVAPNGNAIALRSPANYNNALSTGNPVISGTFYDRKAGAITLYDINESSGSNVSIYATTGGANTLLTTGLADARFSSINVNDRNYRVNGSVMVQVVTSLDVWPVGISPPPAAANILVTGSGSLTLATGISASYAYRRSGTVEVGEASAASAVSTSGTNKIFEVGVTASTAPGVDGIVLFLAVDGGSVRYLVVNSDGDPIVYANSSATISITSAYTLNLNVQETTYNAPPTLGARHVSGWKNRLMLTGYTGATSQQQIVYSGFDQIFYGQPWSCYPPLNILTIPNKSEAMQCGTETDIGWFGLSDRDAYLVAGAPTDKVDPDLVSVNVLQLTEQLDPFGWGIGTRSPHTLVKTSFGPVWLDQNKRIQLWPGQGRNVELARGLRNDLDTILDTDAARYMAEGAWYQAGSFGGFYVLTASTSGSTNNRMWVVTMIQTPEGVMALGAPADIAAQCIFIVRPTNEEERCFIGITDRVRQILDFDTEGAGWPTGTNLYFDMMSNNERLYSTLYGLRFDGRNAEDITVQVRNSDDTNIEALPTRRVANTYSAMVNRYGQRQKIRFNFPNSDGVKREIANVVPQFEQIFEIAFQLGLGDR